MDQREALIRTSPVLQGVMNKYGKKIDHLHNGKRVWCQDGNTKSLLRSIVFTIEQNGRNFKAKKGIDEVFDKDSSIYEYLLAQAFLMSESAILKFNDKTFRIETNLPDNANVDTRISFFDLYIICKRQLEKEL